MPFPSVAADRPEIAAWGLVAPSVCANAAPKYHSCLRRDGFFGPVPRRREPGRAGFPRWPPFPDPSVVRSSLYHNFTRVTQRFLLRYKPIARNRGACEDRGSAQMKPGSSNRRVTYRTAARPFPRKADRNEFLTTIVSESVRGLHHGLSGASFPYRQGVVETPCQTQGSRGLRRFATGPGGGDRTPRGIHLSDPCPRWES